MQKTSLDYFFDYFFYNRTNPLSGFDIWLSPSTTTATQADSQHIQMEDNHNDLHAWGFEQASDGLSRSEPFAVTPVQTPALHQRQTSQQSGVNAAAFRSSRAPSSNTSAYRQLYGQDVLQSAQQYMQSGTFSDISVPSFTQMTPLARSARSNGWPSTPSIPAVPTHGQWQYGSTSSVTTVPPYMQGGQHTGFGQQSSELSLNNHHMASGRASGGLTSQFNDLSWPTASPAVAPPDNSPPMQPPDISQSYAPFPAAGSLAESRSHLQKRRQQDVFHSEEVTPPRKRTRRQPDPERVARKPAPPRKPKQSRDLSTLVSHMNDEDAQEFINGRAGYIPRNAPIFMQQFSSKQYALDHLLRVGSSISFLPPPSELAIDIDELDPGTRATLQQLLLEAVAEEPSADAIPSYLQGEKDRRSFADKNKYQHAIVLKKMADPEDSSACVCLLVQCLIDLHDKDKGIPINDLHLCGQSIEEIEAKAYDPDKLSTKKGNYSLDFSLSFFQRVTLLVDIVKKYKWVAKDVLLNTNILEMVVSPRQYLSMKLNNSNTAKIRQERWNEDQIRRGTKAPEQGDDAGVDVAQGVELQRQNVESAAHLQEQAALLPNTEAANSADVMEDPSNLPTSMVHGTPSDERLLQTSFQEPDGAENWYFDDMTPQNQAFGWSQD